MTEENLLTEWARLLLESLADAGVRRCVLSPGSRSTPFAAAALRCPRLECFSLVDERDAAFFALGLGKADGVPALLICTSGTAGANYLPAVIEAEMSYSPLLVLTADRPTELVHCHAPQTIDQIKLFADHARAFFELGAPDPSLRALRALRRTAAQAVLKSFSPLPGAVHLNARARKPLEPAAAASPPGEALRQGVDALLSRPLVRAEPPRLVAGEGALDELLDHCRSLERGLIVCGPAPLSQARLQQPVAELARRTGYPVLAEAASQLRFAAAPGDLVRAGALDALGRSPSLRERLVPEVILQLGAPPTAAGWSQYVDAHPDCPRFVLAPHGWNDPWDTARALLQADLGALLAELLGRLGGPVRTQRTRWLRDWRQAEQLARKAAESVLEGQPAGLSEGLVARRAVEALPPGSLLAVGNSLPIREVDAYAPPDGRPLRVWSQRGASGIDGVVAGAAGCARALEVPAALLVGDVSFLHDLGGLAALRFLRTPFALVVVHNDGGRIFEQLPLPRAAGAEDLPLEAWLTPHGLDLEPAARLHRLPFARAGSDGELQAALVEALARGGATVIEARVPPHGAFEQNRLLWQRTEEALSAELAAT